jgi:4-amino-4-deoxy-L-arabinose transferase-like glycosyltransferase
VSVRLTVTLLAAAALVLASGAGQYPSLSDDEGTYAAQAWALLSEGSLAHYTYWYDHPPLGWMQLALGTWLLGPLVDAESAVATSRAVMIIPALVSAALVYVLCRRLGLRRPFAAAALLLFALSPLSVSMLRMVYLDNFAMPWVLAAFVLAASPRRQLWEYAASGACFAVAVLSKETTLLMLPGLVLQVMHTLDRRTRAFCLAGFGTAFALIGLGYPLYAVLKGELLPGAGHVSLVEAIGFQLWGRPGTGTALDPGSASYQLVANWLSVDAWLLGLGVALAPAAVFVRRLRPVAVTLLVLVAAALRPGYLPQPYVIALLPFCAVVAAGVADVGWRRACAMRGPVPLFAAAVAALVLAALVPAWYRADSYATRTDTTGPALAAGRWAERHVDRRARLLVDDTFYVDLVRAGFEPRFGVVWFYKLDYTTNLDPSIARNLPQGWRAFDYLISSPVLRSALDENPSGLHEVRRALTNSRVVATFGAGATRVEVRRIVGVGTGSGLIPSQLPVPDARVQGERPAEHRTRSRGQRRATRRGERRRARRGAGRASGRRAHERRQERRRRARKRSRR